MKFQIKHETKGRMRVHLMQKRMSYEQADTLLYYLHQNKQVSFVKVYERTADAAISEFLFFVMILQLQVLLCSCLELVSY